MAASDSDSGLKRMFQHGDQLKKEQEALWAQAEERARPTVHVLMTPLSAHPEGLLERVQRRVTELFVVYERIGTPFETREDWTKPLRNLGVVGKTEPDMTIECFSALVLHHFGGNAVKSSTDEQTKPLSAPRKKKEAFIREVVDAVFGDDDALKRKLVAYAQDCMDWCFRSCLEYSKQRKRPDDADDQVLVVFRFRATVIAGLWHFGLVPLQLYWDLVSFCMLGRDTKADIREFGPDGLRDIANKTQSAHMATARSMIHMFFAGVTRDKPRQAALYCQLFNFSSVLLRVVHIGSTALRLMDASLGKVLVYSLERLLILFQQNTAMNEKIGVVERRHTTANLHIALMLTLHPTCIDPVYDGPVFTNVHSKLARLVALLWALIELIGKLSSPYDFSGVHKKDLPRVMRESAAAMRAGYAEHKLLVGMGFPFPPARSQWVQDYVRQLHELTFDPTTNEWVEKERLLTFMAMVVKYTLYAIPSHLTQEFAFKFQELLVVLRDVHDNRGMWAALSRQCTLSIRKEVESFQKVHKALGSKSYKIVSSSPKAEWPADLKLSTALEVDFSHECLRRVCRLVLLAGNDSLDGCGGEMAPDTNGRKWRNLLYDRQMEHHQAACDALESCFAIKDFHLPFEVCLEEWILGVCTLMWKAPLDPWDGEPAVCLLGTRHKLAYPYAGILEYLHARGRVAGAGVVFGRVEPQFALHVAFDPELMHYHGFGNSPWMKTYTVEPKDARTFEERERAADAAAAELLAAEEAKADAKSKPARKRNGCRSGKAKVRDEPEAVVVEEQEKDASTPALPLPHPPPAPGAPQASSTAFVDPSTGLQLPWLDHHVREEEVKDRLRARLKEKIATNNDWMRRQKDALTGRLALLEQAQAHLDEEAKAMQGQAATALQAAWRGWRSRRRPNYRRTHASVHPEEKHRTDHYNSCGILKWSEWPNGRKDYYKGDLGQEYRWKTDWPSGEKSIYKGAPGYEFRTHTMTRIKTESGVTQQVVRRHDKPFGDNSCRVLEYRTSKGDRWYGFAPNGEFRVCTENAKGERNLYVGSVATHDLATLQRNPKQILRETADFTVKYRGDPGEEAQYYCETTDGVKHWYRGPRNKERRYLIERPDGYREHFVPSHVDRQGGKRVYAEWANGRIDWYAGPDGDPSCIYSTYQDGSRDVWEGKGQDAKRTHRDMPDGRQYIFAWEGDIQWIGEIRWPSGKRRVYPSRTSKGFIETFESPWKSKWVHGAAKLCLEKAKKEMEKAWAPYLHEEVEKADAPVADEAGRLKYGGEHEHDAMAQARVEVEGSVAAAKQHKEAAAQARAVERERVRERAATAKKAKKQRRRARADEAKANAERAAEAMRAAEVERAEAARRVLRVGFRHFRATLAARARKREEEIAAEVEAAETREVLRVVAEQEARERAAAEAAAAAAEATNPPPPEPPQAPAPAKAECVVCLDAEATHVVVPCGHICLCGDCTQNLPHCPLCRTAVLQTMRVFFNN